MPDGTSTTRRIAGLPPPAVIWNAGEYQADYVVSAECAGIEPVAAQSLRKLIEDDWLQAARPALSTRTDAGGACDGVKNGKYGFHTGAERNPWWQVDLGAVAPIARIVVRPQGHGGGLLSG